MPATLAANSIAYSLVCTPEVCYRPHWGVWKGSYRLYQDVTIAAFVFCQDRVRSPGSPQRPCLAAYQSRRRRGRQNLFSRDLFQVSDDPFMALQPCPRLRRRLARWGRLHDGR